MNKELQKHDIGGLMRIINDKLCKNADAALAKYGLSYSQTRALRFITRKGGKVTQKEIENYLKISHPTTVGLVSRLEKGGFVECYTDAADKRNKIVAATSKADEYERFMHEHIIESEKILTNGFTADEIIMLRDMLCRLYENMDK